MTESRYKIEYVQPEPTKEKNFRLFGAFGYLWLALLASVLTYGIVYKHISTSEIISYFQNIKTEVINTNISSLTETPKRTETFVSEESIIADTETTKGNTVENVSLENTGDTQKLVSEVINDNQLPEDVVFESEAVEPTINQTQQEETESIVSEIIKEQNKQEALKETTDTLEPTDTIESATAAIEIEMEKTEAPVVKKPATQEAITEEIISLEQDTVKKDLVKEIVVENTAIEESKELVSEIINDNQLPEDVVFESEAVEPTINQTQQEETESIVSEILKEQNKQEALKETTETLEPTDTIESATAAIETELEKNEAPVEKKPAIQETITEEIIGLEQDTVKKDLVKEIVVENTATEESTEVAVEGDTATTSIQEPVQKEPELEEETKEKIEKQALAEVKKNPMTTLSKLVNDAVSNPNENDLAYIKSVTDYEKNKIATSDFLERIKSQENKASDKDSDISTKKPEKSEVSAVDAIIAAMNADKAAKEKPPLSYQEKIQSEVNLLLKNKDKAQSTNQINN